MSTEVGIELVNTNGSKGDIVPESQSLKLAAKKHTRKAHLQFGSLLWCFFLIGWNDGSLGPLLPRIQEVYKIGFVPVSLLFVFTCVGSFIGAVINVTQTDRLGFGKMVVFGSLAQWIAYSMQAAVVPFPAFVLANFLNGMGSAVQDAQGNGFVAALNDSAKMGYLHAAYGAGAFAAPLVATQFSQMPRWSFHFLVSLGISLINTTLLTYAFRLKDQDGCLADIGREPSEKSTSQKATYKQILRLKTVHLLGLFILTYVGVEVTIGGWIVTYMVDVRHGGAASGYVSSGFWGGLMVGRVALLWFNRKLGEHRALLLYAILAVGLQLIVWLVPSLVAGAVAVSFVGVLLGPTYPLAMNHAGRVLPPWLLTGSIGWIGGIGTAGAAFFPFLTGVLASKVGIQVLQPLIVAMMVLMALVWIMVPKAPRRVE
ncbi:major facilitator superfamily domain-containing protein [Hygrophoropsis aurantiaca]|uniref:Major facilitator superfamily domain-containing protein n=1 Tax=Hygrophoropsis aurantiaca TaxID=72124 RepID=A0ACB8AKN1_9AGAM|nr:major facilitator superfamily domain-containing protein [Hygrophoropsis aurantiaca]